MFLVLATACDAPPPENAGPPLRPVRTLTVSADGEAGGWEFAGVVDAARKAELGFRIPGTLAELLAREGDQVEAGKLLARIDAADHEIQLASRQAEYDRARADLERGQELVSDGVIARSEFDRMKAQEATAHANLETARQNVESTYLRAPFAGRIAARHVDNHEELAAMQAVYSLHDPSALVVTIDVPERLMIRVPDDARPRLAAVFDAFPEQRFDLVIDEVSTRADPATNTYRVRLRLPMIDTFNVLPGMAVTVQVSPDPARWTAADAVVLPAHAVLEDQDGRFVFVASPTQEGRGTIDRRGVTIGRLTSAGIEITGGLQPGDRVVTAGMSHMHPGLEVRLDAEPSG